MKNSKSLLLDLIGRISLNESDAEKRSIAAHLIESICGVTSAEAMTAHAVSVSDEFKLNEALDRINRSEPLQYILNEAWFYGRKFYVDPGVLIPRPETEELVALILGRTERKDKAPRIVDVATGSGCIGISLALELRRSETWGTDISDSALRVARRNAASLASGTQFLSHNVLVDQLPVADVAIIVSNPPYIAHSEMTDMDRNVLEHEPHLALFVPDNDPLLFYHALTKQGMQVMIPGGMLAVEINARFGREVAATMTQAGLQRVELLKDIAGKERFVIARKPT